MAAGLAIADLALPEAILKVVNDREKLDTWEYSLETNTEHQTIVGAIKSLESLGDVVKTEPRQFTTWAPTEEGQAVMEHGSHEVRVFEAVDPKNGTPQSSLMKSVPNAKIGFSKAMSSGWLRLEKNEGGEPRVYRKVDRVVDNVANILKSISGGKEVEGGDLKELKKRKLVTNVCVLSNLCEVLSTVVLMCVRICIILTTSPIHLPHGRGEVWTSS
jgi:phenylalanyl-tRNA synthetase alpha chain